MVTETEYVIEPSKKKILDWQELWQYRELFYFFTLRDVKVKYKHTSLGVFWVVLQPVFTVLIFSLFFGRALQVPSSGLPYPVFVFSGLLLWNLFSASVNNASSSMLTNAPIIKKIYFPRVIIPISSILVAFIDFFIAFLVFVPVLIFYDVKVDILMALILWPIALVLLMLATTGISCLLAALTIKYKDFRFVIPFGLQITLFVCPIIYPLTVIGNGWISYLFAINPIYSAIMLFRAPILGGVQDQNLVLLSTLFTILVLIAGVYYFKKTEDYFADIA